MRTERSGAAKVRLLLKKGNHVTKEWPDGWATKSKSGTCVYLACEFVILSGEYENRKVWSNIGLHSNNSEKYGEIGRSMIKAILNSARGLHSKDKSPEAEKQRLLNLNKTQQQNYQKVIADKSAQIAQIKAALFKLAGAASIQFGDAVRYAKVVQSSTGVDPAFLLAIIKQESNLGSNVGKCYLSDTSSGAGINPDTGRSWPNLMKPSRDIPPFLDITSRLGFDPLKTAVSCPIAGAGGWGGCR
jgi:hypothetical protein